MIAALLALIPLALAAPMERTVQSQRIVVKEDPKLCLTARGVSPSAGDIITVEPCQPNNDQFYVHQYWLTGGVDSTGPIELASFGVCISAGTATPGNYTSLTLETCDNAADQSWYWFGGYGLELNNQCITRFNETVNSGVCAGKKIQSVQTYACEPFATTQTFTTSDAQ